MSRLLTVAGGVAGGLLLLWLALLAMLWWARRTTPDRASLGEALRLLPDVLRLLRRLAADRTLPRSVRVRLGLLLAYLLIPIDLVPDFIPVLGYADDAIIVALALRSVSRRAGTQALTRHWPGTPEGLAALRRLAGLPADDPGTGPNRSRAAGAQQSAVDGMQGSGSSGSARWARLAPPERINSGGNMASEPDQVTETGRFGGSEVERTAASRRRPVRHRARGWFRYTLPGLSMALVFVCLSFSPSLLPRSGLVQGVVCGITGAIGYGLGVVGAWLWRAFADRDARSARRRSWQVFAVVAVVALVAAVLLGRYWQGQVRELMGAPGEGATKPLVVPVVTAVVFVVIVAVSRLLRSAYRGVSGLLGRWVGPRAARAVGWVLVVGGTALLVSGVLLDSAVALANRTFAVRNGITPAGVLQPTTPLRSGGPGSLVPWSSLGREGRKFAATGPTAAQITAFTGVPAQTPIRAYAGLESADTAERRAALAVDDLARAGGFDRGTLVVATTTGSGWIDPASADTIEYLTGGDSAVVSMQYSYLPSWISYLVDQKKAREAGRELFDAVYDRWSKLPLATRPRLVVFGESLGSFGGEAAFSGEHDLRNRTGGVVFAGPPNFNTLYREFTDDRDAGSHEVQPVYRDGRTVRFANEVDAGVDPVQSPWDGSRVLYLQHPSDPIVWWSPRLMVQRPGWLREARGRDVAGAMQWIPFVTFWQVTADLPFATGVPAGHGHKYTREYVDGWAQVLRPAGWSESKAAQLRDLVDRAE